ncbi:hypothetical protein [Paludibacterium yongneupense]|uniref:hypothetical protein n=1 Tax=Paludibacterium yongneupense TaxID=400061 RepID=UPI0003F5665F|nr:hypothetical protein [Paludibacterium yongneupense]
MSKKTSIYISDRAEDVISQVEGGSLSGRINNIVDRYGLVVSRARRGLMRELSPEQLALIRQAAQGWATGKEPAGMLIGTLAARVEDAARGALAGEDVQGVLAILSDLEPAEELALIEWLEQAPPVHDGKSS